MCIFVIKQVVFDPSQWNVARIIYPKLFCLQDANRKALRWCEVVSIKSSIELYQQKDGSKSGAFSVSSEEYALVVVGKF